MCVKEPKVWAVWVVAAGINLRGPDRASAKPWNWSRCWIDGGAPSEREYRQEYFRNHCAAPYHLRAQRNERLWKDDNNACLVEEKGFCGSLLSSRAGRPLLYIGPVSRREFISDSRTKRHPG